MHQLGKGQFKLGKLRIKGKTGPEIWKLLLLRDPFHAPEPFIALMLKVCTVALSFP
jgi:hypothetical protein